MPVGFAHNDVFLVDFCVFFDWYANPRKATFADYWEVNTKRFESLVKDGTIEIYDSLPEQYMDIFERQAIERNN